MQSREKIITIIKQFLDQPNLAIPFLDRVSHERRSVVFHEMRDVLLEILAPNHAENPLQNKSQDFIDELVNAAKKADDSEMLVVLTQNVKNDSVSPKNSI